MLRSHLNWVGALNLCFAIASTVAIASDNPREQPQFLLLKLDGAYVKWGDPVLGTGATVRYGFVVADTQFPGARNCEAMTPLDRPLLELGIQPSQLHLETAAAFSLWERVANIKFEPVADLAQADILIGGQATPRGRAFADVSFRASEQGSTRSIGRSLICINQTQPWKIGFGGNSNAYDIRYTIAHEIGHAIGLNHPGPSGQLMGFKYAEKFRTLQPGDMDGAVALYGSREGTTSVSMPPARKKAAAELGLR